MCPTLSGRRFNNYVQFLGRLSILSTVQRPSVTSPFINTRETTRAGAFLRVEVWDWNRGISDDPLGSFEVKIGEELLSQKARDRIP